MPRTRTTFSNALQDDSDSEDLLAKAAVALKQRQLDSQEGNPTKPDSKALSALRTIKLDAGMSSLREKYLVDEKRRPAKLNPNAVVVTEESEASKHKPQYASTLEKVQPVDRLVIQSQSPSVLPVLDLDTKTKKKQAQKEKEETMGPGWFGMKNTELTPEVKRDLLLIKSRNVLDPKKHFKRDTRKGLPKHFQVGTVIAGAADFYSGRLARKERHESITGEIMADLDKKKYFKRKFLEIQEKKQEGTRKAYKKKVQKNVPVWRRK
ncbi:Fcf2 pre-rRNA processing-domain-containing protein [Polychytrium aggregatum]|uniref:Fcf2 pre-rRNA processing-domain-containing protein n=1 Tax=Polychytrium aggregatum TaxID=110093 RepID=UPI0022FEF3C1|nr:Fcf2 pre-rRNA processing-domain-containing protein [Polychytrium aggregatum]KAI9205898.1 Fcf2 pre-rRNA processing-domain-containing protein [Polychytrium aggregatum]